MLIRLVAHSVYHDPLIGLWLYSAVQHLIDKKVDCTDSHVVVQTVVYTAWDAMQRL